MLVNPHVSVEVGDLDHRFRFQFLRCRDVGLKMCGALELGVCNYASARKPKPLNPEPAYVQGESTLLACLSIRVRGA